MKPAFCVSLSIVYFHTNVLFLYAAQSDTRLQRSDTSFWAERRKAVEAFKNQNSIAFNPAVPNTNSAIPKLLAQLPTLQTQLSVIATPDLIKDQNNFLTLPSPSKGKGSRRLGKGKLNELNKLILPYAEIKETYLPNAVTLKHNNSTTPLAVIIQDVHQHYEAQKNIANVLNVVAQFTRGELAESIERRSNDDTTATPDKSGNYKPNELNKPVVIGVEGAGGSFDFSPYRAYSDKKLTADIADSFIKEGMIGGPEFYGITAPDNQLMPMIGVEDEKLYLDNIQAFKDSLPVEKQVKEKVEKLQDQVRVEKSQIFSKELLDIDTKREQYHENKLDLGEYLTALTSIRHNVVAQFIERRLNNDTTTTPDKSGNYNSVVLLVEAYQIEKTLDFTKVDKERTQIIEVLSEKLSKARLNELVQISLAYRSGNITYAQFYAIFKAMAQDAGINFGAFPAMNQYVKYVLLTDKIDKNHLFDEIIQLEKSLENKFAETLEEKQMLAQSKYLELVKKLVDFSLTPDEWKQYRSLSRSVVAQFIERRSNVNAATTPDESGSYKFNGLSLLSFEQFYETALKRNEALVSNLLKSSNRDNVVAQFIERRSTTTDNSTTTTPDKSGNYNGHNERYNAVAVLVAGGFHTNGLTQILKQKNVPYVVLTPNITKVEEGQKSLELLARGTTPLEKLFAGEKIFLVAPLGTGPKLEGNEWKAPATESMFHASVIGSQENRAGVDIAVEEINSGPSELKIAKAEYTNNAGFSTVKLWVKLKANVFKFVLIRIPESMMSVKESLRNYKQIVNKTKEVSSFNKVRDYWISIRQERESLFDRLDLSNGGEGAKAFVQTRLNGIRNNDIFKRALSMVGFSISFILTSKLLALAFVAVGLPVNPGVFTLFTVVRLAVSLSFSMLLPALIKKLTKSEKLSKYSKYAIPFIATAYVVVSLLLNPVNFASDVLLNPHTYYFLASFSGAAAFGWRLLAVTKFVEPVQKSLSQKFPNLRVNHPKILKLLLMGVTVIVISGGAIAIAQADYYNAPQREFKIQDYGKDNEYEKPLKVGNLTIKPDTMTAVAARTLQAEGVRLENKSRFWKLTDLKIQELTKYNKLSNPNLLHPGDGIGLPNVESIHAELAEIYKDVPGNSIAVPSTELSSVPPANTPGANPQSPPDTSANPSHVEALTQGRIPPIESGDAENSAHEVPPQLRGIGSNAAEPSHRTETPPAKDESASPPEVTTGDTNATAPVREGNESQREKELEDFVDRVKREAKIIIKSFGYAALVTVSSIVFAGVVVAGLLLFKDTLFKISEAFFNLFKRTSKSEVKVSKSPKINLLRQNAQSASKKGALTRIVETFLNLLRRAEKSKPKEPAQSQPAEPEVEESALDDGNYIEQLAEDKKELEGHFSELEKINSEINSALNSAIEFNIRQDDIIFDRLSQMDFVIHRRIKSKLKSNHELKLDERQLNILFSALEIFDKYNIEDYREDDINGQLIINGLVHSVNVGLPSDNTLRLNNEQVQILRRRVEAGLEILKAHLIDFSFIVLVSNTVTVLYGLLASKGINLDNLKLQQEELDNLLYALEYVDINDKNVAAINDLAYLINGALIGDNKLRLDTRQLDIIQEKFAKLNELFVNDPAFSPAFSNLSNALDLAKKRNSPDEQSSPAAETPAGNVSGPSSPLAGQPEGEAAEAENKMKGQPANADAGKQHGEYRDEAIKLELDAGEYQVLIDELSSIIGKPFRIAIIEKLLALSEADLKNPDKIIGIFGKTVNKYGFIVSNFNIDASKAILIGLAVQRFKKRRESESIKPAEPKIEESEPVPSDAQQEEPKPKTKKEEFKRILEMGFILDLEQADNIAADFMMKLDEAYKNATDILDNVAVLAPDQTVVRTRLRTSFDATFTNAILILRELKGNLNNELNKAADKLANNQEETDHATLNMELSASFNEKFDTAASEFEALLSRSKEEYQIIVDETLNQLRHQPIVSSNELSVAGQETVMDVALPNIERQTDQSDDEALLSSPLVSQPEGEQAQGSFAGRLVESLEERPVEQEGEKGASEQRNQEVQPELESLTDQQVNPIYPRDQHPAGILTDDVIGNGKMSGTELPIVDPSHQVASEEQQPGELAIVWQRSGTSEPLSGDLLLPAAQSEEIGIAVEGSFESEIEKLKEQEISHAVNYVLKVIEEEVKKAKEEYNVPIERIIMDIDNLINFPSLLKVSFWRNVLSVEMSFNSYASLTIPVSPDSKLSSQEFRERIIAELAKKKVTLRQEQLEQVKKITNQIGSKRQELARSWGNNEQAEFLQKEIDRLISDLLKLGAEEFSADTEISNSDVLINTINNDIVLIEEVQISKSSSDDRILGRVGGRTKKEVAGNGMFILRASGISQSEARQKNKPIRARLIVNNIRYYAGKQDKQNLEIAKSWLDELKGNYSNMVSEEELDELEKLITTLKEKQESAKGPGKVPESVEIKELKQMGILIPDNLDINDESKVTVILTRARRLGDVIKLLDRESMVNDYSEEQKRVFKTNLTQIQQNIGFSADDSDEQFVIKSLMPILNMAFRDRANDVSKSVYNKLKTVVEQLSQGVVFEPNVGVEYDSQKMEVLGDYESRGNSRMVVEEVYSVGLELPYIPMNRNGKIIGDLRVKYPMRAYVTVSVHTQTTDTTSKKGQKREPIKEPDLNGLGREIEELMLMVESAKKAANETFAASEEAQELFEKAKELLAKGKLSRVTITALREVNDAIFFAQNASETASLKWVILETVMSEFKKNLVPGYVRQDDELTPEQLTQMAKQDYELALHSAEEAKSSLETVRNAVNLIRSEITSDTSGSNGKRTKVEVDTKTKSVENKKIVLKTSEGKQETNITLKAERPMKAGDKVLELNLDGNIFTVVLVNKDSSNGQAPQFISVLYVKYKNGPSGKVALSELMSSEGITLPGWSIKTEFGVSAAGKENEIKVSLKFSKHDENTIAAIPSSAETDYKIIKSEVSSHPISAIRSFLAGLAVLGIGALSSFFTLTLLGTLSGAVAGGLLMAAPFVVFGVPLVTQAGWIFAAKAVTFFEWVLLKFLTRTNITRGSPNVRQLTFRNFFQPIARSNGKNQGIFLNRLPKPVRHSILEIHEKRPNDLQAYAAQMLAFPKAYVETKTVKLLLKPLKIAWHWLVNSGKLGRLSEKMPTDDRVSDVKTVEQPISTPDNSSSVKELHKAGFQELAQGYFFKKGVAAGFLVHIVQSDKTEQLEELFTSPRFMKFGKQDKKIAAIDVIDVDGISVLKIIYGDNSYELISPNDGYSESGRKLKGPVYSPEALRSSSPLKDRLLQNGFQEVIKDSGIFKITFGKEGTMAVVYRDEEILFIGATNNTLEKRYVYQPRIIGYNDDMLWLQEGQLEYLIDGTGHYYFKSLDTSAEVVLPLTPLQQYTEVNPNAAGFVIGGINTNESIDNLTELTGSPIETIEKFARPNHASHAGFLAEKEQLKDVLKTDNEFVLSHGLTHQELAEPLFYVMNILVYAGTNNIEFRYKGNLYRSHKVSFMGTQDSIFNDDLQSDSDYVVTNIQTGASVTFSGLVPFYIWRYGFYEGQTTYRVDPANIIKVFFSNVGRENSEFQHSEELDFGPRFRRSGAGPRRNDNGEKLTIGTRENKEAESASQQLQRFHSLFPRTSYDINEDRYKVEIKITSPNNLQLRVIFKRDNSETEVLNLTAVGVAELMELLIEQNEISKSQAFLLPRMLTGAELKKLASKLPHEIQIITFVNGQSIIMIGDEGSVGGIVTGLFDDPNLQILTSVIHNHPKQTKHEFIDINYDSREISPHLSEALSLRSSSGDLNSASYAINAVFTEQGIAVFQVHSNMPTQFKRLLAGVPLWDDDYQAGDMYSYIHLIVDIEHILAHEIFEGSLLDNQHNIEQVIIDIYAYFGIYLEILHWDELEGNNVEDTLKDAVKELTRRSREDDFDVITANIVNFIRYAPNLDKYEQAKIDLGKQFETAKLIDLTMFPIRLAKEFVTLAGEKTGMNEVDVQRLSDEATHLILSQIRGSEDSAKMRDVNNLLIDKINLTTGKDLRIDKDELERLFMEALSLASNRTDEEKKVVDDATASRDQLRYKIELMEDALIPDKSQQRSADFLRWLDKGKEINTVNYQSGQAIVPYDTLSVNGAQWSHGAGVIPWLQQRIIGVSPSADRERVYRRWIAPLLEGLLFFVPLVVSHYVFGVDMASFKMLGINVITKLFFVALHIYPQRAPPEDIRAAWAIATGNVITTTIFLLLLPTLNIPFISFPVILLVAFVAETAWHWLVNSGKPGKLSERMPTDDRDSGVKIVEQPKSDSIRRSPFLLAVLLAPVLVIVLATTALAGTSVGQAGNMGWIANIAAFVVSGFGISFLVDEMTRRVNKHSDVVNKFITNLSEDERKLVFAIATYAKGDRMTALEPLVGVLGNLDKKYTLKSDEVVTYITLLQNHSHELLSIQTTIREGIPHTLDDKFQFIIDRLAYKEKNRTIFDFKSFSSSERKMIAALVWIYATTSPNRSREAVNMLMGQREVNIDERAINIYLRMKNPDLTDFFQNISQMLFLAFKERWVVQFNETLVNVETKIKGLANALNALEEMGPQVEGKHSEEKTNSQQVISEEQVNILHAWIKDNEFDDYLSDIIVAFADNRRDRLSMGIKDKVNRGFPRPPAKRETVRKFLETFDELQIKQLLEEAKTVLRTTHFELYDSNPYYFNLILNRYDEVFKQLVEQVNTMLRQSQTVTGQSYDLRQGGEVTLRFSERIDRSNPLRINVNGRAIQIWHEDNGSIKVLEKIGEQTIAIGVSLGEKFIVLDTTNSQKIVSIKNLGDGRIVIRDLFSRTGTSVIAPAVVTSSEGVQRGEHPVLTDAAERLKAAETIFSRLYQDRNLTSQDMGKLDEYVSTYQRLVNDVQNAQKIWMNGPVGKTDDERHINQVKNEVNDLLLQLKIFERKKKHPEVAQKLKELETMMSDVEIAKLRNLLNNFSNESERHSWEEQLNDRIKRDRGTKSNRERQLESVWALSGDFYFEFTYGEFVVSVDNIIGTWLRFKEELFSAAQQAKERFKQQSGEVRDIRTLNLYGELGVAKTATSGEIKKAYYALAKKYHPNFNPGNKFAEARFKEIGNIYEVLNDPERRKYYDDYGLILKKQSDYIDSWSFFGKDFSWAPVIGTLYRLGLTQKEVRETFLGSLRNMGLGDLAAALGDVWNTVNERRPMNWATTRQRRLINQATTDQGIEMFIAVLNPFMASYEVSREVINIVWKQYGVDEPTVGLNKALANIAGPEMAVEIMERIIKPLGDVFGLIADDIEVVKKLPRRVNGFKSHKFMAFDTDINGRLKIFIGQRVLEKYVRKGKLDNFLMISLIHESLESLGLSHRLIEQAGFSEKNLIANAKSINELIADAVALAERNGIKVVHGEIDTRRGGMLRDTIQEKLENIVPEVQRDLVKAFELKGKITTEYDNLLGALHLLRMADIFKGNASTRRNVKVQKIEWDAETAARAAWYMSSDELADLMDTYQDWHESGKFDQKKPVRKSARKIKQHNEALAAYVINFFETLGALNVNPGLPSTGMNIDEAVQVFQEKIGLLTNKEFNLSDEQVSVLKEAAELGEKEAKSLESAKPKETESLIKEQTDNTMLGLFEVSALSENTLSQMYGILKLVHKGLAKDVVLPLITNKDAIDEDAIKQALIEMAEKDDDMGKENMGKALKATHFGELTITREVLAEKLGIDKELLVEIDTETVYQMVQEWVDANKGKLRFTQRLPVQVFTETPNHWNKTWREDMELTILAIISATQVIEVGRQTEEHLKLIKQINIQA